jgi:predicted nucleic-acid-binding Zn-ribbon protein
MSTKVMSAKCPKCGGEDFLVRVWSDINVNLSRNFGTVKYDWIEKVTCANVACGYELPVSDELRMKLADTVKHILSGMKKETLILK